jgi:uncharacterized phage infection (PIP) family protein YhgE
VADKPGEYLPPLVTKLKADISDLKAGFEQAKKLQKDYADDLDKLDESFKKTKTSAHAAGQEISDFERLVRSKSRSGETAVSAMRTEYERLAEVVKKTKKDLASGGIGGTDKDKSYKELKQALEDMSKLSSIAADFGIKLGDAAGKGLANGAAAAGPYVQTAIAAAITAAVLLAAPYIGATLAAAMTLGLGAAVIGLGAYILKERPKIKKAWESLTETTSGVFERSALGLEKPFVKAIKTIEREFKKLEKPLTALFNAASPLVQPLANGFMGMLANMLPGLTTALINAKPAFDSLGQNLPKIGTAIGEFFRIISENPDEVALIIEQMINLISNTLVLLAYLISGLTIAYGWIDTVGKKTREALGEVVSTLINWWNGAVTWVSDLFEGIGEGIMAGIRLGIKNGSSGLVNTLLSVLRGAWGAAAGFLQIGSPSKLYRKLGEWTMDGYAQGVEARQARVWDAWAGALDPSQPRGASGVAGYDAARASMSRVRGGTVTVSPAPVVVTLDGRVLYESNIKHSQRGALRNVTTGLTRAGSTA